MHPKHKSPWAKAQAVKKVKARVAKAKLPLKRKLGKGKRRGAVVPTKIHAQPGVMTTTEWFSSSKPHGSIKLMEKVGVPSLYTDNVISQYTALPGYWGMFYIAHVQKNDIVNMMTFIQGAGVLQSASPKRFVLDSYLADNAYTNNSTSNVEVELYDVVCRKDLPYNNSLSIGSGSTVTNYTIRANPVDYIAQGIAAAQGGGTVTPPPQNTLMVGMSPFDSPFFNEYFKVVKRTICQLSPGATHRHTVSLKPNRLVKEEDVHLYYTGGSTGGAMACDKGFQCFTLGLIRTFVCTDVTSGGQTTAPANISVAASYRYKYTQIAGANTQLQYYNNITRPAVTDSFKIVNPISGVVATVDNI